MANGTLKVQNIETSSGSGTITLGQSGETIALGSGATQTLALNTPAFQVHRSADVDLTPATFTYVEFDTEDLDTHDAYAITGTGSSNRFTVPAGGAGRYFVSASVLVLGSTNSGISYSDIYLLKNGTNIAYNMVDQRSNPVRQIQNVLNYIVDLDVGDFINLQVRVSLAAGSADYRGDTGVRESRFGAFRLIGAE